MSLKPVLRHPTCGVLKNVKFRLSRNSTKFDMVARFRETNPTVKSICHPRSRKILDFYRKYHFAIFKKIGIFLGLIEVDLYFSVKIYF